VILYMEVEATHGTGVSVIEVRGFVRPKGTTWTPYDSSATPRVKGVAATAGNYAKRAYGQGMLFCPIGTDNCIQFDLLNSTGSMTLCRIVQLGIKI